MQSLRDSFIQEIIEISKKTSDIVVIDCDVGGHTRLNKFKDCYPERFYQMGICEQNAIGVAAGMASGGLIPIVSSFAAFIVPRAFEQIKHSIIYNSAKVIVFATHAGLSAGEDGATHECFNDLALTMSLPDIEVFAPAFRYECEMIAKHVVESTKPAYVRVGRDLVSDKAMENFFHVGQPLLLSKGALPIAVVSIGEITNEVLEADMLLKKEGKEVRVIHVGSLRPLDLKLLNSMLQDIKIIISVEEHIQKGGLYSLLCNFFCNDNEKRILPLCIQNTFGQTGNIKELRKAFQIDKESIKKQIDSLLGI